MSAEPESRPVDNGAGDPKDDTGDKEPKKDDRCGRARGWCLRSAVVVDRPDSRRLFNTESKHTQIRCAWFLASTWNCHQIECT